MTTPTLPEPDPATAPYSQVFEGVLRIRALEPGALGIGTGFVVGDGTWVLTNRHVVIDATAIELETWDGRSAGSATLVGVAPGGEDLALLRRDGPPIEPLGLRLGRGAQRDEPAVTAGYPGGRLLVRELGTVLYPAQSDGTPVLVTDLPCEPGCSGSPVFGADGLVVGVIVGGTANQETLAIVIDEAVPLLAAHGITG